MDKALKDMSWSENVDYIWLPMLWKTCTSCSTFLASLLLVITPIRVYYYYSNIVYTRLLKGKRKNECFDGQSLTFEMTGIAQLIQSTVHDFQTIQKT